MELRESHSSRPIDFSSDCAGPDAAPRGPGPSTLTRRALLCLALTLTLAIPIPGLAADGESSTTTLPDATTTTTLVESTTTTVVQGTTTTTTPGSTTTTNTEEENPTVEPSGPEDVEDPLDGENPDEIEVLPLPSIRFPVVGRVAYRSTYGQPRDGGARLHNGTDIFAEKGSPVVAVAPGRVVRMGITEDAGLFVVVRHNDGWRSVYVHLNNDSPGTDNGLTMGWGPAIQVGVTVRAGTLLGYVGDSGNAEESSAHLHFELHQPDGFRPDPYPALRAASRVSTPHALSTVDYRQVDALNAEFVGHVDPGTGFNSGLSLAGDHAYVGTWGNEERCPGTGIRIFDVSDPSEPIPLGVIADHTEFPGTAASSVWVGDVEIDTHAGRIGLVGLADCNDPLTETEPHAVGVAVYDLEDPAEPVLLAVHEVEGAGITDLAVDLSNGQLTVAAVVSVLRSNTPGIHETLVLFEMDEIESLRRIATWSPPVISGRFETTVDVDELLSGASVDWLDRTTIAARLRSFGDVVIDVSNPESPVGTAAQSVEWTLPDRDVLSGEQTVAYDTVNDSIALGAVGMLEARLSVGAVLVRDSNSPDGTELARVVPAPAFDPQRWWLASDGIDEFPLVWNVEIHDGLVYLVDHHSGLWIFDLVTELGRTSPRSDID